MSNEKVYSWIFLAIGLASSETPAKINGIIGVADGINHAVPTHKELQKSFSWLLKHKLIQKEGKHYSLTLEGLMLFKKASEMSDNLFQNWDYLEENFVALNS